MSQKLPAVCAVLLGCACIGVAVYLSTSDRGEPFYQSLTNLANPEPIFVFDSDNNEKLRREMSYQTTSNTMGGSPDGIHINVNTYKNKGTIKRTRPKNNTPNPDAQVVEAVPYHNDNDAYFHV